MNDKINKIKNNKLLSMFYRILRIISVFLIVAVVCIIFVQRISNNKVTVAGYSIYTVVSESMVPEYNLWDMIIIKKTDPSEIKIGDDVVYQGKVGDFADKIVTHRVIEWKYSDNSYKFITKGIANDIEDPEIDENQIYGKVLYKSFILSTLSKIINNLYGFYFIVFIPFVIMLFFEIIDIVNERERLKKAKRR